MMNQYTDNVYKRIFFIFRRESLFIFTREPFFHYQLGECRIKLQAIIILLLEEINQQQQRIYYNLATLKNIY